MASRMAAVRSIGVPSNTHFVPLTVTSEPGDEAQLAAFLRETAVSVRQQEPHHANPDRRRCLLEQGYAPFRRRRHRHELHGEAMP